MRSKFAGLVLLPLLVLIVLLFIGGCYWTGVVVMLLLGDGVFSLISTFGCQSDSITKVTQKYIPFGNYSSIMLWGILFTKKSELSIMETDHEHIHKRQWKETGYALYYIMYLVEFTCRMIKNLIKGQNFSTAWSSSYSLLSFETEAYRGEKNIAYLNVRRNYIWIDLMFDSKATLKLNSPQIKY